MKGKIKGKYPAFWLIRHRSGNIRDHPQRYHINVGKRYGMGNLRKNDKYNQVDKNQNVNGNEAQTRRSGKPKVELKEGMILFSKYNNTPFLLKKRNTYVTNKGIFGLERRYHTWVVENQRTGKPIELDEEQVLELLKTKK